MTTWQDHALARVLDLPARAKDLRNELRSILLNASNSGRLQTSPREVYQRVEVLPEPPQPLASQLRERGLYANAFCIVGAEKNLKRDRAIPHFKRDDGAWFDFTIAVREGSPQLELLAYDFEIRLPAGTGTPFLRFDLNIPEHRNEDRDLRSHLHPGSDDMLVPAPTMTPTEILTLFVEGLRRSAGRADPRAPTAFEIEWLRDTHALLPPP